MVCYYKSRAFKPLDLYVVVGLGLKFFHAFGKNSHSQHYRLFQIMFEHKDVPS